MQNCQNDFAGSAEKWGVSFDNFSLEGLESEKSRSNRSDSSASMFDLDLESLKSLT